MTNICEQCGKKIGVFSNSPFKLSDDRVLCFECASKIWYSLDNLYYLDEEEFNSSKDNILKICRESYKEEITEVIEKKIEYIYNKKISNMPKKQKSLIENYMLTTGYEFSGYKITKYNGIVSGQSVLGTGFLSEFTASFADFFGEESNKFANKLEMAKNAALERLVCESNKKGSNAIIGVDFDYITFHNNMIGVVANGTSVVIEKTED